MNYITFICFNSPYDLNGPEGTEHNDIIIAPYFGNLSNMVQDLSRSWKIERAQRSSETKEKRLWRIFSKHAFVSILLTYLLTNYIDQRCPYEMQGIK